MRMIPHRRAYSLTTDSIEVIVNIGAWYCFCSFSLEDRRKPGHVRAALLPGIRECVAKERWDRVHREGKNIPLYDNPPTP